MRRKRGSLEERKRGGRAGKIFLLHLQQTLIAVPVPLYKRGNRRNVINGSKIISLSPIKGGTFTRILNIKTRETALSASSHRPNPTDPLPPTTRPNLSLDAGYDCFPLEKSTKSRGQITLLQKRYNRGITGLK